jgi:hypothetical protein
VFPEGFNDYDLALGDSGDMLDLFEACGPGGRLSATDVYLSELPKTVLRKARAEERRRRAEKRRSITA